MIFGKTIVHQCCGDARCNFILTSCPLEDDGECNVCGKDLDYGDSCYMCTNIAHDFHVHVHCAQPLGTEKRKKKKKQHPANVSESQSPPALEPLDFSFSK